jgi:DNA polymerase-3 subunit alpha
MVDDFIDRKHGRAEVAYPHPDLEPILKPTYGVILYQEQVMQIAQVLAGYSLGGADLLRRAMGKKKPEEMAKQGEIFRKGAVERGVEEKTATYIFDLMEKFAGYGFNKSHSAAYALVSYQTMWLKAHYPSAFMAAVCSADMDNTDKVVPLIEECRRMKLNVEAPQVNLSQYKFTAIDEQTVVYGLGAIKGVGESAIETVISEREENGPFEDIFEFCRRIDLRKVNRRVLESLIRAGALDGLGANRATLMLQLPLALKLAEQHHAMEEVGQNDLFGMGDPQPAEASHTQVIPKDIEEWEEEQRLQGEKETLGLYLTGHPIDRYIDELGHICSSRIGNLSLDDAPAGGHRRKGVPVVVTGLVVSASHRQTQRGRMGTLVLDDRSGRIECTLFNEAYEQHRELVSADKILVVSGMLNYDEFRGGLSIRADNLLTFEQARSHYARVLTVNMGSHQQVAPAEICSKLQQLLTPFVGGTTGIRLRYQNRLASGDIQLGQDWRVNPTDELLRRLEQLFGPGSVDVGYRQSAAQRPASSGQSMANNRQRPATGG